MNEIYFQNPILKGDYPDPSILRIDGDFYMTHSSFRYAPGLLIWHSTDLIHWEPVCRALSEYIGDVWAPDLQWIDGLFYIFFPADGKNMFIRAKAIEGPWSKPVELGIGGIDPGFVEDKNTNKRYVHASGGTVCRLSSETMTAEGEAWKCYDGWKYPENWEVEGPALEGPKLTFHNGWYYLTSAHGGTAGPATSHMVISARSKSPTGPWEDSPYNPIVHTTSADEKWWSQGHGTPFADKDGNWWMVLHGYEKGYYNIGRQTLLLPLEWTEDGWFHCPEGKGASNLLPAPKSAKRQRTFSLSDDFSSGQLGLQWSMFGEYDKTRISFCNGLRLKAKNALAQDSGVLAVIPCDNSYEAEVTLTLEGDAEGGILLFYSPAAFVGIGYNGKAVLQKQFRLGSHPVSSESGKTIQLKIRNKNQVATLFFHNGEDWQKIATSFEISGYHHNVFGGFLGLRIGLYSAGHGAVLFQNFRYTPLPR